MATQAKQPDLLARHAASALVGYVATQIFKGTNQVVTFIAAFILHELLDAPVARMVASLGA